MKKYCKFNLFHFFILFVLIFSILNQQNVYASPFNDFEISMDIIDGKASIDMKSPDITEAMTDDSNFFNMFLNQYSSIIIGISGISSLTCLAVFVINFISLGKAGNSMNRSKALNALLWSGISGVLLGGVSIIIGISYGILR